MKETLNKLKLVEENNLKDNEDLEVEVEETENSEEEIDQIEETDEVEEIDVDDLKEYLNNRLTKYMIPTVFMQIDEMPKSLEISSIISRK